MWHTVPLKYSMSTPYSRTQAPSFLCMSSNLACIVERETVLLVSANKIEQPNLIRHFSEHVCSMLLGTEDDIFFSIEHFYVAPKNVLLAKKSQRSYSVLLPAQGQLIEITVLHIGQTSVCRWGPPAVTEKLFPETGWWTWFIKLLQE